MSDCIFCQIGRHEVPKEFTLETSQVMVFPDIHPVAPVHLLIVSKKHIEEFTKAEGEDENILGQMLKIIKNLIKKYKLETSGYRIVTNGGGAQLINHFHIHLMGGITSERKL
jgi:histidine triad (HIT) family protein